MKERAEICRNSQGQDVILEPLHEHPDILTYFDITNAPTNWINTAMARYYGNKSIKLKTSSLSQ